DVRRYFSVRPAERRRVVCGARSSALPAPNRGMRIAVRSLLLAALAIPLLPLWAAPPAFEEGYALVRQLMSEKDGERHAAARKLLQGRDVSLVPALVDALFFTPKRARAELLEALRGLTGEDAGT